MKDLKYPVAYYAMPIEHFDKWDFFSNPTYKVAYNIAVPCYVVCERKHYEEDGSTKLDYEIVPCNFINDGAIKKLESVVPDYSSYNEKYLNSIITEEVDYDFSKIFELCEKRNRQIMINHYLNNDGISGEEFFNDISEIYKLFDYDYERPKIKVK